MTTDFLYLAIIVVLAALLVGSDKSLGRVRTPAVNGRVIEGGRIVTVRRWLNARAGLLNHAGLGGYDGLLLAGCRSVHTHGMLFSIDLVFLGESGRVLAVRQSVSPGARFKGPQGCCSILELAAGAAASVYGIAAGDLVTFEACA